MYVLPAHGQGAYFFAAHPLYWADLFRLTNRECNLTLIVRTTSSFNEQTASQLPCKEALYWRVIYLVASDCLLFAMAGFLVQCETVVGLPWPEPEFWCNNAWLGIYLTDAFFLLIGFLMPFWVDLSWFDLLPHCALGKCGFLALCRTWACIMQITSILLAQFEILPKRNIFFIYWCLSIKTFNFNLRCVS